MVLLNSTRIEFVPLGKAGDLHGTGCLRFKLDLKKEAVSRKAQVWKHRLVTRQPGRHFLYPMPVIHFLISLCMAQCSPCISLSWTLSLHCAAESGLVLFVAFLEALSGWESNGRASCRATHLEDWPKPQQHTEERMSEPKQQLGQYLVRWMQTQELLG